MKKSLKVCSCLLGSVLVLTGCHEFEANWPMETPNAEDMTIDTPWSDYASVATSLAFATGETNLNLNKGETHQYVVTAEPRDTDLSSLVWESDNEAVATIENGLLTAVGGGKANISAKCGDAIARSLVNVTVPLVDFNVENKSFDLDYGEEVQIVTSFSPSDTTQNKMSYELLSEGVVTVSSSGVVTALGETGDAQIKVTNEVSNKVETVTVHVSDKWNYVDYISLSGIEKLEVTKSAQLVGEVVAKDTTNPASTLATNSIVYSVKEGSEEFVSVNAETGEVTALEPGNATIVASIFDERKGGDPITKEFSFEVFEVSATAISLTEDATINLDNNENSSHQLAYTYSLSESGYEVPSRGNVIFSTSDANVAKVSDTGLIEVVGVGDAVVTVKDETYGVSDSIEVHTTIYAKSVSISAASEFYLDETLVVSASVTPAKTTDDVTWEYTSGTTHKFVEEGSSLKITCTNLDETVEVKAHVDSVESNVITLEPKERDIPFEDGKVYIVGSSNYKTGVSKDAVGGSWSTGKYAFIMTDKTGNPNALYEYKATIEFREGDLWKIRENANDWRGVEGWAGEGEGAHQIGLYKVTEGAFADGLMSVTNDGDQNIVVNKAGKYDIYFAHYTNENPEGWYEVYASEHGLKVDTNSVHAKLGAVSSKVEVIKASEFEGTLAVKEVDETFINVSVNDKTGEISILPVGIGETTFIVYDNYKEVEISVKVEAESTAETTDYYLRGTAVGDGWGNVMEENVMTKSSDDNNIAEIIDIKLSVGEFKIADQSWKSVWGYKYQNSGEDAEHITVAGGAAANFSEGNDGNIKCNVAGYYNIYLTKNNYIYIEQNGVTPPTPVDTNTLYLRGTVVNGWDAVDAAYALSTSANPNNIAEILGVSLSVGDFKISNSAWSKLWGYKYKNEGEEVDHITVAGGAAENFSEGKEAPDNIHCDVAGKYNIYLTTNNYIYIESAGDVPTEPSITFGIANPQVSVDGSLEIPVTVTGCSGLEYRVTSNAEYVEVDSSISDDTKLVVNGLAEGTSTITAFDSTGKVTATIDVKCTEGSSPIPEDDKELVVKVYRDGGWTQLEMSPTVDKETQYEYTGDFAKDEVFVIHMEDDVWYHYEDVKEGCKSLVSLEGSEDIKLNLDGNYSIYADYTADENGDHVWIKRNIAPATMVIEGVTKPTTMEVNPDKDGEFMIKNVSLETNEYFHFEYDGVSYGFENIKSDSPEKGTSNLAKHIAVTTAGDYDIYFDPGATGGKCIYIAPHVDPVETRTIYIETKGWFNSGASNEHVYVYAYDSKSDAKNAEWPGIEGKWIADISDGKKIFSYNLPVTYDTFVIAKFVDGQGSTSQTGDISVSSLGTNNCVYLDSDTFMANNIPVGFYTY